MRSARILVGLSLVLLAGCGDDGAAPGGSPPQAQAAQGKAGAAGMAGAAGTAGDGRAGQGGGASGPQGSTAGAAGRGGSAAAGAQAGGQAGGGSQAGGAQAGSGAQGGGAGAGPGGEQGGEAQAGQGQAGGGAGGEAPGQGGAGGQGEGGQGGGGAWCVEGEVLGCSDGGSRLVCKLGAPTPEACPSTAPVCTVSGECVAPCEGEWDCPLEPCRDFTCEMGVCKPILRPEGEIAGDFSENDCRKRTCGPDGQVIEEVWPENHLSFVQCSGIFCDQWGNVAYSPLTGLACEGGKCNGKGVCMAACNPGERRCALGQDQVCTDGGEWQIAELCQGGESQCDSQGCFGVEQVAMGRGATCVVRTGGKLFCWGDLPTKLGLAAHSTPQFIPFSEPVHRVSVGDRQICALSTYGNVRCAADLGYEKPLTDDLMPMKRLVAGDHFACAATAAGQVYCWGWRPGTTEDEASPVPTLVEGANAAAELVAGRRHVCAMDGAKKVRCWGDNGSGQLGDGSRQPSALPVEVAYDGPAQALFAGHDSACVQGPEGLVCWGDFRDGMMGVAATESLVPVAVPSASGASAALGRGFSCLLREQDGEVLCRGANDRQQTGQWQTGAPSSELSPVGLPLPAKRLTAGVDHACAVLTDGRVFCWGSDAGGKLGWGGGWGSRAPVAVRWSGSWPEG